MQRSDARSLAQVLLAPRSVAHRRPVERRDQDRRPAAEVSAAGRLRRAHLSDQSAPRRSAGRARLAVARRAARSARARLCRDLDRGRDRGGRGMRPARRSGRHRCSPTASAKPAPTASSARRGCARSARSTGMRIVGPSSLGVVDLRHKTFLTANAAFDEPDLPVGRIFAASHSGGMIGTFLSRGKARGIGFAGLVSVGNEVDLSIGEICAGDARRRRHRRLRAVSRNHAQGAGAARASRSRPRRAASRCWPTSSAARPPRASLRCRTPARSPARTTSPACSWPNAASRGSTRSKA